MSCNRCNWQTQPAEYGFTECFCDLLTPYQNEEKVEKEKKEEVKTLKVTKEAEVTIKQDELLKRTGC
jgi:hypothetical protein